VRTPASPWTLDRETGGYVSRLSISVSSDDGESTSGPVTSKKASSRLPLSRTKENQQSVGSLEANHTTLSGVGKDLDSSNRSQMGSESCAAGNMKPSVDVEVDVVLFKPKGFMNLSGVPTLKAGMCLLCTPTKKALL
jgi:hypothetical protein